MKKNFMKTAAGRFPALAAAAVISAAVAFSAVGCKGGGDKKDEAKGGKGDATKTLATLGSGKAVTLAEVDAFWKEALPDDQKMQFMVVPEWKKKVLDEYLSIIALSEEAKKQGLDNDPEYLANLERMKARALAQLYFKKKVEAEIAKIKAETKDIDEFYKKNRDKHFFRGWREVSQIVVAQKADADKLYSELSAAPQKFAEAAKQKSIDEVTKAGGGYLGKITKTGSSLPPEVLNTVFTTEKGAVSKPSQSRNGWHIFFVKEKSPDDYMPLDDALRKQLVNTVEMEKKQDKLKSLVEGLKKQMNIKIDNKYVEKIGEAWQKEMEAQMQKMGGGGMPAGHGGAGMPPGHGGGAPEGHGGGAPAGH